MRPQRRAAFGPHPRSLSSKLERESPWAGIGSACLWLRDYGPASSSGPFLAAEAPRGSGVSANEFAPRLRPACLRHACQGNVPTLEGLLSVVSCLSTPGAAAPRGGPLPRLVVVVRAARRHLGPESALGTVVSDRTPFRTHRGAMLNL